MVVLFTLIVEVSEVVAAFDTLGAFSTELCGLGAELRGRSVALEEGWPAFGAWVESSARDGFVGVTAAASACGLRRTTGAGVGAL
jgi:hypothetical protein